MNEPKPYAFPAPGERVDASHANDETLELLTRRRSTAAIGLSDPGPTEEQIEHLLGIACRVPDHGKLAPWRFIVFDGDARTSFGNILGKIYSATTPDASAEQTRCEQERFTRAPLVIAVISSVLERHKVPVWEQELSAGAVCQNLLIAASAMGFAAQWLTEWYAYDPDVKDLMGLRSGERIAGFVYIGTATEPPVERKRGQAHIGRWKA
jgi:nitroreductase